jgi:uncharacterized protein (DUF1330 family)
MSERVWGFASYTLAATAVLAAGSYVAWRSDVDAVDIAAWVQAVGSIAAIVGAVWISRSEAQEQIDGKWQGVLAIVATVERELDRIAVALDWSHNETFDPREFFSTYRPTDLQDLEAAIGAIPLHESPYGHAALRLVALRRNLKKLSSKLQSIPKSAEENFGVSFKFTEAIFLDDYVDALAIIEDIREATSGVRQRRQEHR